jgi:hypothetical protein
MFGSNIVMVLISGNALASDSRSASQGFHVFVGPENWLQSPLQPAKIIQSIYVLFILLLFPFIRLSLFRSQISVKFFLGCQWVRIPLTCTTYSYLITFFLKIKSILKTHCFAKQTEISFRRLMIRYDSASDVYFQNYRLSLPSSPEVR